MLELLIGMMAVSTEMGLPPSPKDALVKKAVTAYEQLDYHPVAPLLEAALDRRNLSRSDRIIALAYLGRAHAAFGNSKAAVHAFCSLVELAPNFRIHSNESPRIRAAWKEARRVCGVAAATSPVDATPETTEAPQPSPPPLSGHRLPTSTAGRTMDASPPPPPKPTESRMLYWVAGLATAAIAATGAILLATQPWQETPVPAGSWGPWQMP